MANAASLRQSTISIQSANPVRAERLGQIGRIPGPVIQLLGRIGLVVLLAGIACWDAIKR